LQTKELFMAQRASRPTRPDPSDSVILVSTVTLFVVSIGVLFLASCERHVGPSPEIDSAPDGQETLGSADTGVDDGAPSETGATPATVSVAPNDASNLAAYAYEVAIMHSMVAIQPQTPVWNTERYDSTEETGFLSAQDKPLSTFSIDVDTASYSNVRRFLSEGISPPEGAVRIEEMVNYFRYPSEAEAGDHPFAVETEIFAAPWSKTHRLARVALSKIASRSSSTPARVGRYFRRRVGISAIASSMPWVVCRPAA
jgi:hypothetical protein